MLRLINYNNGELVIADDTGPSLRLSAEQANRLVLSARMHNVDPFIAKLQQLIPHEELATKVSVLLEAAQGSERWNLKEKFARLRTVFPDYPVENPDHIAETIPLI